jgi:hypothetical protein
VNGTKASLADLTYGDKSIHDRAFALSLAIRDADKIGIFDRALALSLTVGNLQAVSIQPESWNMFKVLLQRGLRP